MHWLQSTLLMNLNGVLMPVLILNVSTYFLGLRSYPLTLWQGPMVSRWKYGNAFLVYRSKPGHLTPPLVLLNWLLQTSAWILRTGSRPTRTFCRFGPVVEEIQTRSGLWLQRNWSVSLLLLYSFIIVSYDGLDRTLDTDGLSSPIRFLVYTISLTLCILRRTWLNFSYRRTFLLDYSFSNVHNEFILVYRVLPTFFWRTTQESNLNFACGLIREVIYCETWNTFLSFGNRCCTILELLSPYHTAAQNISRHM